MPAGPRGRSPARSKETNNPPHGKGLHNGLSTQKKSDGGSLNVSELTPVRYEYVGADEVKVSLKTNTGDNVTYTLTTAMLVKSVNLSVALINNCTAQVFRDLDVF